MEFLVPLMPLFATLPLAVAAAWIVHRILVHRERHGAGNARLEDLEQEVQALHAAQMELQERVDFSERVLGQVREAQQHP
ncbi:MAG: hypothetical protein OEY20_07290 [Gemmatimonadota bacterium]|nr:hypothetical protein [Gemmatimonadota bacterium]MDH5197039.1 hypothetical protein [Gemmatimonadota bacterium]